MKTGDQDSGGQDSSPDDTAPQGNDDAPGGSDAKSTGDYVPIERFNEVIAQVHDLKNKLNEVGQQQNANQQPQAKEKTFTRQQLRSAVDTGTITQDQADEIWDAQLERRLERKFTTTLADTLNDKDVGSKVDAGLKAYKKLVPDLMRDGSTDRLKVADKFQELVERGHPNNKATELTAAEMVLGSLQSLEAKLKHQQQQSYEKDQQGSGGQGGGKPSNSGGKGKSLMDRLPPRYKKYYEQKIESGLYTNEQAEAEIKRTGIATYEQRAKRYG